MVTPYVTGDNAADDNDDEYYQDYADGLIEDYILKTLDDTEEIWY